MRRSRYVTLLAWLGLRGTLSRRQWQPRSAIQYLPFLRRELTEAPGLNLMFSGVRRHGPQGFNSVSDCLFAVRGKTIELCSNPAKFLFLLGRQVFPSLHAAQHLLLAVWRHGIETL